MLWPALPVAGVTPANTTTVSQQRKGLPLMLGFHYRQ